MDLSSLTRGHSGAIPGAYDNPMVETRIEFDQYGRPYYAAVPAPVRPGVVVPASAAGPVTGPAAVYEPVQPYYAVPAAVPYSPVRDPFVCRLVAAGAVVAGGCIGLSFVLRALAAAETALGFVLAALVLLWLLSSGHGASSRDVHISINNHNNGTGRRRR